MFCKQCGKEVNDNMRFCSRCGTSIDTKTAERLKQEETAAESSEVVVESSESAVGRPDRAAQSSETVESETAVERPQAHWYPAIIGATAVLVAALVVAGVYVGVIKGNNHEAISFNMESYESKETEPELLESQEEVTQSLPVQDSSDPLPAA